MFRLVCNADTTFTSGDTRAKAFRAILRAGAIIDTHYLSKNSPGVLVGDRMIYTDIEYFHVYHPSAAFKAGFPGESEGIPADVDMMAFIAALDDTVAFRYAYPYYYDWSYN